MEDAFKKRICQNCEKEFVLDSNDFGFFEKMKVPPPTWCPECLFVRRMVFRNENKLYHRTNNAPNAEGSKLISMYSEDKPLVIYDHDYWWSDNWDAYSYGKEYDFSKPFFEQMKELIKKIPWPSLMNWNAVRSDYCNCTSDNKNCYLVFGGDFNEDCSYSTFNMHSRDSQDLYLVNKCDLCYECTDIEECYKVSFSQYSRNCSDCMFLYNCLNCNNCVGCINLRNASFMIFNKQYSKEEYLKTLAEFNLDTRAGIEKFKEKFYEFRLKFPHKYANITKSVNCTGDNITEGKNSLEIFSSEGGIEDCKNAFITGWKASDARYVSHVGHNGVELVYDSFGVLSGSQNVKFSIYQPSSINVTYAYNCPSSSFLFGCVGIKNGEYAILNKRYTKEEYEELVPKIIKHMDEMPYIDKNGKIYKYGEFFPPELSPFCYNETIAFDYYPLSKEEAEKRGYSWKDQEIRNYKITIRPENIPGNINDVSDSILNEVIGCAHEGKCNDQCSTAFRIIPLELQFYRRMNIPLPKLCPNCRHYARLRSRNPMKLWHRRCMCENDKHGHPSSGGKGCQNEFETPFAPDKPEIVYCESCYNKEVY